jgi:hypothetical protein
VRSNSALVTFLGRSNERLGHTVPSPASSDSELLELRMPLQTARRAPTALLELQPLAPGVAWHPGCRQGIPRVAYWCRSVSAAAHKLRTEATPLPEELPAAVLQRLVAEGITTCEQWLTLRHRRREIFGITRAKVAQIDAAVTEAVRT